MSFGGSKNPPWQRNSIANAGQRMTNLQAQMGLINPQIVGFAQNQQFNQNIGMAQQQQQNMSIISQMGGNVQNQLQPNQLFTQAVTYPAPRALNPISFSTNSTQPHHPPQQVQHHQQQELQTAQLHQQNQSQQSNQQQNNMQPHSSLHTNLQSNLNKNIRVFSGTGVVTKMKDYYGFIDEEVYFHKNVCVKGMVPQVGDRVLVEANYNSAMQDKWTASRIQLLTPSSNMQRNYSNSINVPNNSGYNAVPPPSATSDNNNYSTRTNRNKNLSPSIRNVSPERHQRIRDQRKDTEIEDIDRKRRREEREKERERGRDKRDHSAEKRERSPTRRTVAKKRKIRVVPRYMVQIPKINLTMTEADVLELKRRYSNLYVPSDFFFTHISWVDAFPPHKQFSIHRPCSFHIMNKDVEATDNYDHLGDPPDADYLFSAKVMLLSVPPSTEIYQTCFATAEEKDCDDDRDFIHPTRLINFLVGIRGKNETMAIGGPWSRSLDGDNPASDPSVLIRTAIRNCKALTGIDLSRCTQWYRFVELYYRRLETVHKGRPIPARIETVVVFLPDVRSCIPTLLEWDGIQNTYTKLLDTAINNKSTIQVKNVEAGKDSTAFDSKSSSRSAVLQKTSGSDDVMGGGNVNGGQSSNITITKPAAVTTTSVADAEDDGVSLVIEKDENTETTNVKKEPTHFSELDPKTAKVSDLRDELIARNLSSKGLKAQLIARLTKALKLEADASNNKLPQNDSNNQTTNEADEEMVVEETFDTENDLMYMVVIDEYDSTKSGEREAATKATESRVIDEKERQILEKKYLLPTSPHIVVHPSRTAKSGKFDCTLMSLSLLLDYRLNDTKEHSFEVSLFAELFNEMLMRDFGFNIYHALYSLPDKPKEDARSSDESTKKKSEKSNKTNDIDDKSKDNSIVDIPNEISTSVVTSNVMDDIIDDKEKMLEKNSRKSMSKDKECDRDNKKRSSRQCDEENSEDDVSVKSNDRKKNKDRDRHKYYTANLDLLLSFVYFDQTHCGYIFEKDIEDLFYTLGLNLSRAQTRKLVGKVISRDSLYYRKLTDLPKEDELKPDSNELKTEPNMEEIATGNKYYLPVFTSECLQTIPNAVTMKCKNVEKSSTISEVPETATGIVTYKGGLIDIEKLLEQMKRSEKAREDTEQILVDLRKQNSDLSANFSKSQNKIKDLSSDLKSSCRKLSDAELSLTITNKKISDYYSILSSVHDKVAPVIVKTEKSSSRSESSRDSKDKASRGDREKDAEFKESCKPDVNIKKEKEK